MISDQTEPSSFGLQANIAAGLASLFGWIGGLVILLGKPPQTWVRFVAVQSIVLAVAYAVVAFALFLVGATLGHIPVINLLIWPLILLAHSVLLLAVTVAWIITTIKAFTGTAFRLPLIAQYADRFMAASTSL